MMTAMMTVPDNYTCFACQQSGSHWIINCPLITESSLQDLMINPELNKGNKRLVDRDLHFDEILIEQMDSRLKDTVIGYIRECQHNFNYNRIPQQIYYWCLLFSLDADRIANYGKNEKKVDLSRFVLGVYNNENPSIQYESIKHLRQILSKHEHPPIKQVIDSGIVPKLIKLCQDNNYPKLQYESLWTLLNITSGPTQAVSYIMKHEAHICLMGLLKSSKLYEIKEMAMYVSESLFLFPIYTFIYNICFLY